MFNLLMKAGGWEDRFDWIPAERVFEYTASSLVEQFKPQGQLAADSLRALPAFFVPEVGSDTAQYGRLGEITGFRASRNRIGVEYSLNPAYAPVPISEIQRLASRLDIEEFEFRRTHWAVKDVDLMLVFSSVSLDDDSTDMTSGGRAAEWERALNEAVDLIKATTRVDVQLRAISVVRGVVEPWVDFRGERGYFAQQMLLGLDTVAELIREGSPQAQKTVAASLLTHVKEAIDWANSNRYARFAGQLMLVHKFVTWLN